MRPLRVFTAVGAALALAACASIDSTPDKPSVSQSDRARAAQQHAQFFG